MSWDRYNWNFRQWRARAGDPMPGLIVGPCPGYPQRACVQCGGSYDLDEFYYSNGRGGKRPRCIGCMMTRRHNEKCARLGLPLYSPAAAPFVPLRKIHSRKRRRNKTEQRIDAVVGALIQNPRTWGPSWGRVIRCDLAKTPPRERKFVLAYWEQWRDRQAQILLETAVAESPQLGNVAIEPEQQLALVELRENTMAAAGQNS